MRIIILTSSLRGLASFCISRLLEEAEIKIAMVVYNQGRILNPWKVIKGKIKKIHKIGIFGAITGIRIRPWFREDICRLLNIESLEVIANRFGIRLERTPAINCQKTIEFFLKADAELGLSLGNSYIGERIFSIPKYGMINIHHEILPQFQGAQSIIWQIYKGFLETGYTIYQINRYIDAGGILYQEKMPIELKPTLRQTVTHNYACLYEASIKGLVRVLRNYSGFLANAKPQVGSQIFTTPTFRQYLRMVYQHRRLYQEYIKQSVTRG